MRSMLWILKFVKLNRGSCLLQLSYGLGAANEGTLQKVSTQLPRDSKLLLADPESYHFLSLRCDVGHGRQNLRLQFDKLLWLIPAFFRFPVDPNQVWSYPSTFYMSFRPYSRVYVPFHRVAFFVTLFNSFFSRFRVACQVNISLQSLSDACPKFQFR